MRRVGQTFSFDTREINILVSITIISFIITKEMNLFDRYLNYLFDKENFISINDSLLENICLAFYEKEIIKNKMK
jgi:hypothetical protein